MGSKESHLPKDINANVPKAMTANLMGIDMAVWVTDQTTPWSKVFLLGNL